MKKLIVVEVEKDVKDYHLRVYCPLSGSNNGFYKVSSLPFKDADVSDAVLTMLAQTPLFIGGENKFGYLSDNYFIVHKSYLDELNKLRESRAEFQDGVPDSPPKQTDESTPITEDPILSVHPTADNRGVGETDETAQNT